ncbi:hypothetical protein I204_06902 [Kwoniella mangroviensis CBS 8886]|uniref:uncharacterized protein n=1 Tax=Kwoniella mangroviensis CBS 8507 TaxID=1296122 RepID=UPI00080CD45B|nr:uncharacterized protein I203_01126 [Kwoniella mangroviensis CBS 8507]OCF69271.1 hypothetical protein I203_01126 [Kwoniella mangroviensis CBS 8507]OCF72521.1 hypothetical protein I204_06902 [Kwoniella mangroviensis CBS 8886]
MRFFLLTILATLSLVLALPTHPSERETSLLGRFTSLLFGRRSITLNGYETEDEHSPPLPRDHDQNENRVKRRYKTSSRYPRCKKKTPRTGFAHYSGWKLVGNDLSGALPVSPRDNCINLCDNYGDACGAIYFDDKSYRCFLKGVKTESWEFVETNNEGDAVDLVGGCAAWSDLVPENMDDICCRD